MKKLVLFGDSLLANVAKPEISIFEAALPGYDMYNCAAGGWNTSDCAQKAPYIAKLKPDVVVISLGTNDAWSWKQVPMDTFVDNIPKILVAFPKSDIVWLLPPPVDEVKAKKAGENITNEAVKKYHDTAKEICEAHGVTVIDSFAMFKPMLDAGEEYHVDDGIHLNELAYETIAIKLSKLLNKDMG